MKQHFRKGLAIVACMTLALSAINPLTARAAVKTPASVVGYLSSSGDYAGGSVVFQVKGLSASNAVKLSSVKSSDTDVAKVHYVRGYFYYEKSNKKDSFSEIGLLASKAGTATVSYKVGKTQKSTKVTIKEYENPIKSISLTGVNNGKDFADLTNDNSYVYGATFTVKATKNPVLKVEPASGWSVTSVTGRIGDDITEDYSKFPGKKYSGAQTFTLYKLYSSADYLDVSLVNKDGGEMRVSYQLQNS